MSAEVPCRSYLLLNSFQVPLVLQRLRNVDVWSTRSRWSLVFVVSITAVFVVSITAVFVVSITAWK